MEKYYFLKELLEQIEENWISIEEWNGLARKLSGKGGYFPSFWTRFKSYLYSESIDFGHSKCS